MTNDLPTTQQTNPSCDNLTQWLAGWKAPSAPVFTFHHDYVHTLLDDFGQNLAFLEDRPFPLNAGATRPHGSQQEARDAFFEKNMAINDLYECLVAEIRSQHTATRQHMSSEATQMRNEIIACINANPAAALDLFSRIGLIVGAFSLAVRAVTGLWILNPWLALLICFGSFSGLGMAAMRRKSDKGISLCGTGKQ